MNISNVKEFIKSGLNEKLLKEQIFGGSMVLAVSAAILFMFGFQYGGMTLFCAVTGDILSILSVLGTAILTKKFDLKQKIRCNALLSSANTVIFSLAAYMFMEIEKTPFRLCFCLIPLVFAGISILYAILGLRAEIFLKKKKRKNMALIVLGTSIGIFLSKICFDVKDTEHPLLLLSAFLLVFACIGALGAWNFIKLHYIKRLENQGIDIE